MEVGRGGACVPARVALQGRIHQQQMCIMRNAQPFLRMEKPPLRVGMCSLRMETLPLRLGDMPFVDGNAAARTFGRAHRRRPYHFSCGSMSQGRRKRLRRWAKTREVAWWEDLMEAGRDGACVPARVALQGRIHR